MLEQQQVEQGEQAEQVEIRGFSTPDKISVSRTKTCPSVVELPPAVLMENLLNYYRIYRNSRTRRSWLSLALSSLCQWCASSLELARELWRQLIPEELRGELEQRPVPGGETQDKERKCFQEFMQKRNRFFVIVFDDQSSEEEMQEAFEKASFLTPEGRGITIQQLVRETSCANWTIKEWNRTKRYSILFFKFDLFGNLLNFGHLTKQLVQANRDHSNYFQTFRSELLAAYDHYQAIQREFVSCYMEKEDRVALDLE